MTKRYDLSEALGAARQEVIAGQESGVGRDAKDNRQFVKACLWIIRSGAH